MTLPSGDGVFGTFFFCLFCCFFLLFFVLFLFFPIALFQKGKFLVDVHLTCMPFDAFSPLLFRSRTVCHVLHCFAF